MVVSSCARLCCKWVHSIDTVETVTLSRFRASKLLDRMSGLQAQPMPHLLDEYVQTLKALHNMSTAHQHHHNTNCQLADT